MSLLKTAALLLGASLSVGMLTQPIAGAGASGFATRAGAQAPAMPDGPGRSLVTMQCVGCHALDMTLGKRATAEQWRVTVQAMVDRGAKITSADAEAIAAYLGQHYTWRARNHSYSCPFSGRESEAAALRQAALAFVGRRLSLETTETNADSLVVDACPY